MPHSYGYISMEMVWRFGLLANVAQLVRTLGEHVIKTRCHIKRKKIMQFLHTCD